MNHGLLNQTSMFALAAVSALTTLASMPAHADVTEGPVSFSTLYVPRGFDSNDNVQFVAEGVFKNTCFRPAPTNVQVDQANKKITLGPLAYKFDGTCLEIVVPYDRTIDLGHLKAGNYQIVQKQDNAVIGTLPVLQATRQGPDDFLYAPISQAYLHQNKDGSSAVMVSGTFQSTCMTLKEVKVNVEPTAKSIVVQPIAEWSGASNCEAKSVPFEQSANVSNIPKGRWLLHVRSMNGQAVNNLVDVD